MVYTTKGPCWHLFLYYLCFVRNSNGSIGVQRVRGYSLRASELEEEWNQGYLVPGTEIPVNVHLPHCSRWC